MLVQFFINTSIPSHLSCLSRLPFLCACIIFFETLSGDKRTLYPAQYSGTQSSKWSDFSLLPTRFLLPLCCKNGTFTPSSSFFIFILFSTTRIFTAAEPSYRSIKSIRFSPLIPLRILRTFTHTPASVFIRHKFDSFLRRLSAVTKNYRL